VEDRAKKARRLLNVLEQLHEIEEQKKLQLQRRAEELDRSQKELIGALNSDDALHGMFMDTTARFLKSLGQEAQRVAEAQELQAERLRVQATKMKTAERLTDNLEQIAERRGAEKELQDVIERYTGRRRVASLP
jgi:hypothetical protein